VFDFGVCAGPARAVCTVDTYGHVAIDWVDATLILAPGVRFCRVVLAQVLSGWWEDDKHCKKYEKRR